MNSFTKNIMIKYGTTDVNFTFFDPENNFSKNRQSNFHQHFRYEIHFASKGFYEYEFTDRKITLHENEFLIIPPKALHKAAILNDEQYDFKTIMLKIDSAEDDVVFDNLIDILNSNSLKAIDSFEDIRGIVDEIYKILPSETFLNYLKLNTLTNEFIYTLISFLCNEDEKPYISEKEDVLSAIEMLVTLPDIRVSDIAKKIHYSVRQTERLIKKIYGKTLSEIKFEKFAGGKNEKEN